MPAMGTPALSDVKDSNRARQLELTEVEETLRRLLLDVASYIENRPSSDGNGDGQVTIPDSLSSEKVILRYTGGWVRDKLLGVDSHDIDVAINKLTGLQFGLLMKEYLEIPGNPEKYGLEGVAKTDAQSNKAGATARSKIVGGLHKIEANPEKSKHLETVTTRILGLDIDLVNLRKETYSEESRNPQMEFGTPEEDALRRDATVNAMFYNLNTREIEDFTNKGHADMARKLIRTPLEPHQTFKDDPLRVLRLIRFASRLGYSIDPPAEESMKDADIKDALRAKISRERVGIELGKMLKGPSPHMAISIIERLDLYSTIFVDPNEDSKVNFDPEQANWKTTFDTLKTIMHGSTVFRELLIRNDEETYAAWLLACMVPYRHAPSLYHEPGKKPPPPIAALVAREGIKATNKESDIITAAVNNLSEISTWVGKQHDRKPQSNGHGSKSGPFARDTLGMMIRRLGASWRSQVVFSALCDIADEPQTSQSTIRDYENFVSKLRDLDLLEAYALKPLIDGKMLTKALSAPPGPWMKEALDVVMAWQLRNPEVATTEGALEEVRNSGIHGELTADLVNHFLRLTIRPLFAKSQHPAVTTQGRKVTTNVLPKKMDFDESDEVSKPWKYRETYALDLLRWIMHTLDDSLLGQHWPLLIPPLLSITDDTNTANKALGCALIGRFLQLSSSSLLVRTGLADVFQEALMPCLGFLPTLTPEPESVKLLSAAYPALLALSNKAYDTSSTTKLRTQSADPKQRKIIFLDTLLRKGILVGYSHCPEHFEIIHVLLQNLACIADLLGIEIVKHLKYVLPMLTEILGNPFSSTYPPLLLSALKTSQAVVLNGWPRMAANRGEVLKGLTLCWLHVHDAKDEPLVQVQAEARRTVQMLTDAVRDECEMDKDLAQLVESDERLAGLFVEDI